MLAARLSALCVCVCVCVCVCACLPAPCVCQRADFVGDTSQPADNPYWSFDDSHAPPGHGGTLSLWVALDDATLNNGCLLFVPVCVCVCVCVCVSHCFLSHPFPRAD